MHIAEVVTIAKSLPLLRLNTYKSLILSYSADYRRIFHKKTAYSSPSMRTKCFLWENTDRDAFLLFSGWLSGSFRCLCRGVWLLRLCHLGGVRFIHWLLWYWLVVNCGECHWSRYHYCCDCKYQCFHNCKFLSVKLLLPCCLIIHQSLCQHSQFLHKDLFFKHLYYQHIYQQPVDMWKKCGIYAHKVFLNYSKQGSVEI